MDNTFTSFVERYMLDYEFYFVNDRSAISVVYFYVSGVLYMRFLALKIKICGQ